MCTSLNGLVWSIAIEIDLFAGKSTVRVSHTNSRYNIIVIIKYVTT